MDFVHEDVKDLIANNQTNEAITLVKDLLANKDTEDQIVILESEFNRIQSSFISGISDSYNKDINSLNSRLLMLSNQLSKRKVGEKNIGIYLRDMSVMHEKEKKFYAQIKDEEIIDKNSKFSARRSLGYKYPISAFHYESLFPNNYLPSRDILSYKDIQEKKLDSFTQLIENNAETTKLKSFIVEHNAFFIIGSVLNYEYGFGHHALYVFEAERLLSNRVNDYVLIGKGSGGHQFLFLRMLPTHYDDFDSFEASIERELSRAGNVEEWIIENYEEFVGNIDSFRGETYSKLPKEFDSFDRDRFHFSIVAGKRNLYDEETYAFRRRVLKRSGVKIFHYNNLLDLASNRLGKRTY